MRVFIDTEFTDLRYPELISIGLVTQDNKYWHYVEIRDYRLHRCTDFVKKEVLIHLQPTMHAVDRHDAATAVQEFLRALPYETLQIAVDYEVDFWLLEDLILHNLFEKLPDNVAAEPFNIKRELVNLARRLYIEVGKKSPQDYLNYINQLYSKNLEWFYLGGNRRRHHSLDDAIGIREAFLTVLAYAESDGLRI